MNLLLPGIIQLLGLDILVTGPGIWSFLQMDFTGPMNNTTALSPNQVPWDSGLIYQQHAFIMDDTLYLIVVGNNQETRFSLL